MGGCWGRSYPDNCVNRTSGCWEKTKKIKNKKIKEQKEKPKKGSNNNNNNNNDNENYFNKIRNLSSPYSHTKTFLKFDNKSTNGEKSYSPNTQRQTDTEAIANLVFHCTGDGLTRAALCGAHTFARLNSIRFLFHW